MSDIIKMHDIHTSDNWKHAEKPPLSVDVRLPCLEGSAQSGAYKRINRYYSHLAKKMKKYCRTMAAKGESGAYEISYTVTRSDDEILSIYCDICKDNEVRGRLACTWDILSGYPLPLSRFTSLSRHAMIAHISQADNSCSKRSLRRFFDPDNFYVCDDCVKIYYQPMSLYRSITVFRCEGI